MSKRLLKPNPEQPEKVVVAIYIPVELRDRIDAFARDAKVSRSWLGARLGEGWLADKQEEAA
jgi:hypothetical protein